MPSSSIRNIGIVTWDFDPPKGGLGRALQQMAGALRELGHDVRVAAPSGGMERVGTWTRRFGLHPAFSLKLFFWLQCWIARTGRKILLFPSGPGGLWLLRKPKHCTTVAIVYHTYLQQIRSVPGQQWKYIFLPLERASLRRADHIFCFAADTKNILEQEYRYPPDRVHLLPQIIELRPWLANAQAKEPGLCICVARLEQRKGIRFLAELWPQVQERCHRAKLLVVGDGLQAGYIDRLAARGSSSVERVSSLPQSELIAAVQRAELLLCPSYLEGFGLTVLEAMAAGTLVLASNVDGIRALVRHGQTGVLLPMGEHFSWVQAVEEGLTHSEERERMERAARLFAQRCFERRRAMRTLQACLEAL